MSKRTVQNDIARLEAEFGIRLDRKLWKGRQRIYRYYDTCYSLPLFRMNDKERNKIEDAICVLKEFEGEPLYDWARTLLMQIEGGLLNENSSPVVSFQSNPDLKGISYFFGLLQAILSKRVLRLRYTPFGKETITTNIYPYYLKQYNNRWFLIAQAVNYDSLTNYALDRIDEFEEAALPYKETEVDFTEFFDEVVGVSVPEGQSEDVVLKVSANRFNYIRTKPFHLSQRILEDNPDYAVISINVKINKELVSQILSFGSDVEVISPLSLRARIASKIRLLYEKYVSNEENLHT